MRLRECQHVKKKKKKTLGSFQMEIQGSFLLGSCLPQHLCFVLSEAYSWWRDLGSPL